MIQGRAPSNRTEQSSIEDKFEKDRLQEWGEYGDQNEATLFEGWLTPGARDIYQVICRIVIVKDREEFAVALDEFYTIVMRNTRDLGAIHRKLNYTFLDFVLTLPLLKNHNKILALHISEILYKFLLERMEKSLSNEACNKILANGTHFNFKILQRAISSLSVVNVKKTLDILSEPGREKILYENLINLTRHQYSPMQQALLSGNRQIIKMIFDIFFKKVNVKALKYNLQSCSTTGFMTLLTAIKSGTDEDVVNVIKLLESLEDNNRTLIENLNNRNVHGFMVLQAACRSGSMSKLKHVISLLQKAENKDSLTRNLNNRTQDGFMAMTCAVATGSPEIVRLVLDLFRYEEGSLKENLKNLNRDGSNLLQNALISKSKEVVSIIIEWLSKEGYEQVLEQNLITRCVNQFIVLQESLKTGQSDLVKMIIELLVKHPMALVLNLCNINASNYTCLMDAIKSCSLVEVETIIALSEAHLPKPVWQKLLMHETTSYSASLSALHMSLDSGEVAKVKAVIDAIKRAFPEQSTDILRNMVKDVTKLYRTERTSKTFPFIAEYLPQSLAEILPTLPSREKNEGVMYRLLGQASYCSSEAEFNTCLKTLKKLMDRFPEQLTDISPTGWTHLTKVLFRSGKEDNNRLFSFKKSKILFSYLFQEMKKLQVAEFRKILSAKTDHDATLLQEVLYYDREGDIFDILIKQYAEPGFEDLLTQELSFCSKTGATVITHAISSKCPENIDRLMTLLSKPENRRALKQNLMNKTHDGYRVLHDAVRTESIEMVNKIANALIEFDDKEILERNLANYTKSGFSVLDDALTSGLDDIVILIINMAEQYLGLKYWKNLLIEENTRHYACLHIAANKGSATTVKLLMEAIIRAFGQEAEKVIVSQLKHEEKFHSKKLNHTEMWKIYLNYFENKALEQGASRENSELVDDPMIEVAKSKRRRVSHQSTRLEMPRLPQIAAPVSVSPHGGISDKYLSTEGPLPKLPEPLLEAESNNSAMPLKTHAFMFVHALPSSPANISRRHIKIASPSFDADYYTYRTHPKDKMLTFIVAGRKRQALIPQPKKGRCVLVFTQKEYEEISSDVPPTCDILVVKKLHSPTHGNYEHKLTLPTSRRLAIFLFAEVIKLPSFMMLDDNIAKVDFQAGSESWDDFYKLMNNQLGNLLCVSVKTESYKVNTQGELGSKLFMVNLQAIRALMGGFIHFFALFPQASEAHKCLEDYYMQLMCYALHKTTNQGYQIVDDKTAALVRSKKHTHAFMRGGGSLAQLFEGLDEGSLLRLPENVRRSVEETKNILNRIVDENIQKYLERKRYLENADLQLKHAYANKIAYRRMGHVPISLTGSFMERFQALTHQLKYLPNTLRDYQKAAIECFSANTMPNGTVVLPTSAGKTLMQCQIALMARPCLRRGQHIFIVTPHISLVKQFYLDFVEYNRTNNVENNDLRVPPEAIITVSSNKQSCHIRTLLMNKRMQNQNCIFIFCAKSFESYLKESHYHLPHVPLILADEHHYYPSILKKLVDNIRAPKPRIIGCTATPLLHEPMPLMFQYPRAEGVAKGYIASVIADSLGVEYSKKNVYDLIHCFPRMISQYHPGFGGKDTLRDCQGIFFLPSIAHCELAYHVLRANNIPCYSIHSKNKQQRKELARFIQNEEPGVLLAVKLCLVGLNIKRLGYIVIGQNANPHNHAQVSKIEQMIGRVMRVQGDKVGYVLSFKNVWEDIIKPSLSKQVITQPISPHYLQQENVYYTRNGKSWKVCDNYDKTFIKKVFLQSQKYQAKFKIIPQPVTNFSLLKPASFQAEQPIAPLNEEVDFSIFNFSRALASRKGNDEVIEETLWGEDSIQFLNSLLTATEQRQYGALSFREAYRLPDERPVKRVKRR